MKFIITIHFLQFLFCFGICTPYFDYTESEMFSEEEPTNKTSITNTKSKDCTTMKFDCESCTDLILCVDTEYGFMKQYLTCPAGLTCLNNKCTEQRNPFCDGTAAIPFKCHVPGMFPDPFDCTKYHFCVPESYEIVNHTMRLKHFEHTCQDGETGIRYKYDPKSTYCKDKLENGCDEWPVPLCPREGFSDALKENKSLFYVCDLVDGHLYPHLYVCPHAEEYNSDTTKCEVPVPQRTFDEYDWPTNPPRPTLYY